MPTPNQAKAVLEELLSYTTDPPRPTKTDHFVGLTFSDPDDPTSFIRFTTYLEDNAFTVQVNSPPELSETRIYSQASPEIQKLVQKLMGKGMQQMQAQHPNSPN